MKLARSATLALVCTSLLVVGACGKESTPPAAQKDAAPASAPVTPAPPPAAETSAPAPASSPRIDAKGALELAKASGCTACHAIDNTIVGPAYKDVAAKYRGEPRAARMLIEKVRKGGQGVWGSVAMPPQPQVSESDLTTLVEWILSMR